MIRSFLFATFRLNGRVRHAIQEVERPTLTSEQRRDFLRALRGR